MQLSALLLATGISASSLLARDLATINTIMNGVKDNMQTFDAIVLSYPGRQPTSLSASAQKMILAIQSATSKLTTTGNLTLAEAQGFQPTSDAMNAAGDKLLADIKSRIPIFGYGKECQTVLSWTQQLSTAVSGLMTGVSSHFPSGGKGGKEIDHFGATFTTLKQDLAECVQIQYTYHPRPATSSSSYAVPATVKQTLFKAPATPTPFATWVPVAYHHGKNTTSTSSSAMKKTSAMGASKTEGAEGAKQTPAKGAKVADEATTGAGAVAGLSGGAVVLAVAGLLL